MRKIIVFAFALLFAVLVCSCDPESKGGKGPLVGYSIMEEKQFLRLTGNGHESLVVFHLLQGGER